MKEWFKHKHGFINLDDDTIYLTKTGNWTEIVDLKEKNDIGYKATDFASKLKIGLYLTLTIGSIIFALLSNIISGDLSFLLLVGLPILGYSAYKYMIPEIGASFAIPKNKIQQITIDEEIIQIEFLDANNEKTSNKFRGLSEKGTESFTRIKLALTAEKE